MGLANVSILRLGHIIAAAIIGTLCTSCASRLPQLSPQSGTPATGEEAGFVYLTAARQRCSLEPMTGEAVINGTIGKEPINGRFSFAAADRQLRLESVGRNAGDLVFTADEDTDAFMYRGAYVIGGKRVDVIETILGLSLDPQDLRQVLTACPDVSGSLDGLHFGDRWFQVRVDGQAGYAVSFQLTNDGRGWIIRAIDGPIAGTTNRWRAEYGSESNGLPRSVHVVSTTWAGTPGEQFDVRLSLRQIRVNVQLPAETFGLGRSLSIPTTDLESLRRSRPRSAPLLVDPR